MRVLRKCMSSPVGADEDGPLTPLGARRKERRQDLWTAQSTHGEAKQTCGRRIPSSVPVPVRCLQDAPVEVVDDVNLENRSRRQGQKTEASTTYPSSVPVPVRCLQDAPVEVVDDVNLENRSRRQGQKTGASTTYPSSVPVPVVRLQDAPVEVVDDVNLENRSRRQGQKTDASTTYSVVGPSSGCPSSLRTL